MVANESPARRTMSCSSKGDLGGRGRVAGCGSRRELQRRAGTGARQLLGAGGLEAGVWQAGLGTSAALLSRFVLPLPHSERDPG